MNAPANPEMSEAKQHCPVCGTPLKTGALGGLCPACLLKQGASGDTVTASPQPAFTPPTPAELAAIFPQYEILELIGKGGMGAVYKARQKQLDRLVALKILPPGIGNDAAFAERFAREAKALAKLNHPSIVTIYDFGQAENLFFFSMEFVDGVTLRQLLNAGRVSAREALAIVPQICDALQFAHDHGIVHRDIKPENILLDRRGRVKVADFGLAKIVASESQEPEMTSDATDKTVTSSLTEGGKIMGTPNYMAPEQIKNPTQVDHRADIYALGVVFYQMLTGELPSKQIEPPSRKVQIDVRLDEIVLRALEKSPERRYEQASILKTDVETIVAGSDSPNHATASTQMNSGSKNAQVRRASGWLRLAVPLLAVIAGILAYQAYQHFSDEQRSRTTPAGFSEYSVDRRWDELGRTTNPTTPEEVQAALAIEMLESDVATALNRRIIDAPRFSSGMVHLTMTDVNRRRILKTKSTKVVIYKDELAGVICEQEKDDGLHIMTYVLGKRNADWKRALSIELPDVKGVKEAEKQFQNRAPELVEAFRKVQQQKQTALEQANQEVATNMANVAGAMISATREIMDGMLNQTKQLTPLTQTAEQLGRDFNTAFSNAVGNVSHGDSSLQFRFVAAEGDTNSPADLLPDNNDNTGQRQFRVLREVVMNSSDILSAGFSNYNGNNKELLVVLSPEGSRKIAEITSKNIGRQLAIVWQGRVLSAPRIASPITGPQLQINGRLTDAEANLLLDLLNHRAPSHAAASSSQPTAESTAPRCINFLRQISGAKEMWAIEKNKSPGETPTANELAEYIKERKVPTCPFGGTYTINAVSKLPTCTVSGHSILSNAAAAPQPKKLQMNVTTENGKVVLESGSNKLSGERLALDIDPNGAWKVSGNSVELKQIKNPQRTVTADLNNNSTRTNSSVPPWAPTLVPGQKLDMSKFLREAKELVENGAYNDALQRYVWFEKHLNAFQFAGITYVLPEWRELGRRYPPAQKALLKLRDEKLNEFAVGRGYFRLFMDLHAVNRELQQNEITYDLFLQLHRHDRPLAGQCYSVADELLVDHGDYELCAEYMGKPQDCFARIAENHSHLAALENGSTPRTIPTRALRAPGDTATSIFTNAKPNVTPHRPLQLADRTFIEETCRLITILLGTGQKSDAEKMREQALATLDDPKLQTAINDAEQKIKETRAQRQTARKPSLPDDFWKGDEPEINDSNDSTSNNVITKTWSPTLQPGEKLDSYNFLAIASQLTEDGYYDQALQRYLWYHDHVSNFGPGASLLSALSGWTELARRFPKAKQALIQLRDEKVNCFATGQGYFSLFHDLHNINEVLQQTDLTYELFVEIDKRDPELASHCHWVAEEILLEKGAYELSLKYIGDPQRRFAMICQNRTMLPNDRTMADKRFVEQTCGLITVLIATGHQSEAEAIRDKASDLVNDSRLTSAIVNAKKHIERTTDEKQKPHKRLLKVLFADNRPAPPAENPVISASQEKWSPTVAPGQQTDPDKVLSEAKQLAADGKYEDALQRHIWYHNHALEFAPSLMGVRLSFALGDWNELARRYPKAKTALIEIRDMKTKQLLKDQGNFETFKEVNSLNRVLQQQDATLNLFRTVAEKNPKLASQCYRFAEELLIADKDYAACLQFMGEPEARFKRIYADWKQTKEFENRRTSFKPPPIADKQFIEQTSRLIEILVANGKTKKAEAIQKQAAEAVNDPRLKSAIDLAQKNIGIKVIK